MSKSNSNKDAILTLTLLFLLLFLSLHYILFIYLAIFILLLSFFWKGFTVFADMAWRRIGNIIGAITGTIILSAIFFLVVFPISLCLRLLGRSPMQLKLPGGDSNFEVVEKNYLKTDLQNPY